MGERIFEIVHFPFEGQAKLDHLCQLNGLVGWCWLGGNSKGQCTISKIFFPLLLYTFLEQNMFFPKTCLPTPFLSKNSQCDSNSFSSSKIWCYACPVCYHWLRGKYEHWTNCFLAWKDTDLKGGIFQTYWMRHLANTHSYHEFSCHFI